MYYRNAGDVLETFNFLENADDSDEEEDEEADLMEDMPHRTDKQRVKKQKIKVCYIGRSFLGDIRVGLKALKLALLVVYVG